MRRRVLLWLADAWIWLRARYWTFQFFRGNPKAVELFEQAKKAQQQARWRPS